MKRAPRGGGSIRQRSDGRWEGRVSVGHDPQTGKARYKSVYASTQSEVRKKLAKIVAELDGGIFADPKKVTVSDWADEWLNEYRKTVRDATKVSYQKALAPLVQTFGGRKLSEVTPYQMQTFLNRLEYAPSTLSVFRTIYHGLFGDAVRVGLIPANPIERTKPIKKEKRDILILSDDELSALLKECDKTDFGTLFYFLAFTGVRISEALGLTWDRVDFPRGVITIDRQGIFTHGAFSLTQTKNGKARKINAPQPVLKRLSAWREEQEKNLRVLGRTSDLVFSDVGGLPLRPSAVRKQFYPCRDAVGIEGMRLHDFRHNWAALALRAGMDVRTVQESLGHSTASFTLEVYAAVSEQMREESAEKLGAFMTRFA